MAQISTKITRRSGSVLDGTQHKDPIEPAAGNSFDFNRYAYVNNNPIMGTDPTGKNDDCSAYNCHTYGIAAVTTTRAFNNSSGAAYYVYSDGAVVIKSGNRPSRDNNPGDLRHGSSRAVSTIRAIGWDYTKTSSNDKITAQLPFAMFSSQKAGEEALEDTLTSAHGSQASQMPSKPMLQQVITITLLLMVFL